MADLPTEASLQTALYSCGVIHALRPCSKSIRVNCAVNPERVCPAFSQLRPASFLHNTKERATRYPVLRTIPLQYAG